MFIVQISKQITQLNDSRVYNGCAFDSSQVFLPFEDLGTPRKTKAEAKDDLRFWTELNDYAVSQRGETSRNRYRIQEY